MLKSWLVGVVWLLIAYGGMSVDAVAQSSREAGVLQIEAQRKPDRPWKTYTSQTLAQFGPSIANNASPELSKYGGLLSEQVRASGFFQVRKVGSRWWFIDPDGHPLIRMGLTSVYRRTRSTQVSDLPAELRAYVRAEGGAVWARDTVEIMRRLGFNGLGRWSEVETFGDAGLAIPYVTSLQFMGNFGRKLGVNHERYGNLGYRENCMPVFHPDFPAFCEDYAKEATAGLVDDAYLVGHYTDNELPVPRDLLKRTLELDPKDEQLRYNRAEAWRWFRERRGSRARVADVTEGDGEAYLGHVFDRYYAVTSAALKKHDPNHLVLGSRLHGAGLKIGPVVEAASRHVDVVSFNTYGYWALPAELMESWRVDRERPFLVSEFCIKGQDSGLDNTKGAGWIVRTQAERGVWYQSFVIALLQSGHCVGWDYFKYRDDVDVNKGVLDAGFEPHANFAAAVKRMNDSVYGVVERLDAARGR